MPIARSSAADPPVQPVPPTRRPSRALAARLEAEVLPAVPAGGRLPPERELAARYGVGRTVLREALLVLESRDLVASRKGSGTVRLPAPASAPAPLLEGDEIGPFELIQARMVLEGSVAELAAQVATATDLRRVRATLEAHRAALARPLTDEGFTEIVRLDSRFHVEIAEATHNVALIRTVEAVRTHVGRSEEWRVFLEVYERDRDQLGLALEEHGAILERLAARDAAGAAAAMRGHIHRKWGGLRRELMARGLPLDTQLFDIDRLLGSKEA